MPYYETYLTRADAMRRERQLKNWKSAVKVREMIQTALPDLEQAQKELSS
jgi:predicted GIY-YIG superfamily endonuclease